MVIKARRKKINSKIAKIAARRRSVGVGSGPSASAPYGNHYAYGTYQDHIDASHSAEVMRGRPVRTRAGRARVRSVKKKITR